VWRLAIVWALLEWVHRLSREGSIDDWMRAAVFAIATLVVVWGPDELLAPRSIAALPAGFLAGLVGYKALQWLVVPIGLALGLELAPMLAGPRALPDPAWVLASLVAGPVLEELLYRGRLLPALQPRLGWSRASVLSALLFALSHREPWTALSCVFVGLLLAGVYRRARCVWLCVTIHAGLNAGPFGVPAGATDASTAVASAIGGGSLLVLAIRLSAQLSRRDRGPRSPS
jgi:membrane protease YdiL (CAAX protease family)